MNFLENQKKKCKKAILFPVQMVVCKEGLCAGNYLLEQYIYAPVLLRKVGIVGSSPSMSCLYVQLLKDKMSCCKAAAPICSIPLFVFSVMQF